MIAIEEIIEKYYDRSSELYGILLSHSKQVRNKALLIAEQHPELQADKKFIEEAAMLHDIGIFMTYAPDIHCYGKQQYIEHGYLGADLLRKYGLDKHALVCERHTGVGLSKDWIVKNKLPLPHRDMIPNSIEEKIICYADLFFSKTVLNEEIKIQQIIEKLSKFDKANVNVFLNWHKRFSF